MDYRKVEILENDNWTEIDFSTLKKGDTFRMFEPTGEEVISELDGSKVWICKSDAYINEDDIWSVEI